MLQFHLVSTHLSVVIFRAYRHYVNALIWQVVMWCQHTYTPHKMITYKTEIYFTCDKTHLLMAKDQAELQKANVRYWLYSVYIHHKYNRDIGSKNNVYMALLVSPQFASISYAHFQTPLWGICTIQQYNGRCGKLQATVVCYFHNSTV